MCCLLFTLAKNVFCPGLQNCLVSSVQGGKKVCCLLFTLAKNAWCLLGLVSFGSGVFSLAPIKSDQLSFLWP